MGGRGTFAAGNSVAYQYHVNTSFSPDGKFHGVKVLQGIPGTGKHGLPESAHSSNAYLKMNSDGTFNMLRLYGKNHELKLEIAYHSEQTIGKGKDKILHYHEYSKEFSTKKSQDFSRTTHLLHRNSALYKMFRKFFRGVK